MMTEDNMTLLNDTEKCKVIYTWGRGDKKSAIDFILVNTLAYKLCQEMNIDGKQEKCDLSDQNLIEISLKLNDTNHQRRGKWEEKQYYRLDDESLDVVRWHCAEAQCENIKRRLLLFSYGNIICRHLQICYMLYEHTLIINIWII